MIDIGNLAKRIDLEFSSATERDKELLGGLGQVTAEQQLVDELREVWKPRLELNLKSANGTFVNRTRLEVGKRYTLRDGDVLQKGIRAPYGTASANKMPFRFSSQPEARLATAEDARLCTAHSFFSISVGSEQRFRGARCQDCVAADGAACCGQPLIKPCALSWTRM
jgi:hypothetical protein